MRDDPFPRERVATMLRRMPAYLRLSWRLAKDPLLGKIRRAAVIGAAGYLASPVDLVPGVIPVIGQLDDIALALAALKVALAGLDPDRRRVHLDAVGLQDQDLADDLRTVGSTTAWIGRAGLRTTVRVAAVGASAAGGVARATIRAAAGGSPVVRGAVHRAAPAARAARPAALAMAERATPAAQLTGRAAMRGGRAVLGARATALHASGRAASAAAGAVRRLPRPGRSGD